MSNLAMPRSPFSSAGLPRPLETASDLNRGKGVTITGGDVGRLVPILDVRTPCTTVGEPVQITICATPVGHAPECVDEFVLPMVRALVTWGVGTCSCQAEVDVLHGTTLSVTAEIVKVEAFYKVVTVPVDACPECLPDYRVVATLGFGCCSRAQLTEFVVLEAEGWCERVAIPPFARSVAIMTTGGAVEVDLVAFGSCFRTRCHVKGCGDELPIWNGARFVEVTSAAAKTTVVTLIFGLAI